MVPKISYCLNLILLLALIFLLISPKNIEKKTLRFPSNVIQKNGLYLRKKTNQLYTGPYIFFPHTTDSVGAVFNPIKKGKVHGVVRNWSPTGTLLSKAHYKNNKLDGQLKIWQEHISNRGISRTLKSISYFKEDQMKKMETYDKNGKLVRTD
ncbi:hypothetical protein ACFL35_16805 [Candidatus Riflebacteria bacterium]